MHCSPFLSHSLPVNCSINVNLLAIDSCVEVVVGYWAKVRIIWQRVSERAETDMEQFEIQHKHQ